jgi:regulator of replication initiation timing
MTNPLEPYDLIAYIEELKERLKELAQENAELRVERDIARARVAALLPKATPEQEAEFLKLIEAAKAGEATDLQSIIVELERNPDGK